MKRYGCLITLSIALLLVGNNSLFAQKNIGIEEFFFGDEETKVATGPMSKGIKVKESPGIITFISAEEIRNSGVRDLIDVLSLVPGFDFGVDVEGVVSLGIRGLWAQEGKVLLLIDGQEINGLLFSSLLFGNHFSVDQIKQIEIIRGPGSAIYGGFAELGVINVITKAATDINGMEATVTYGQMKDVFARRNLDLRFGKKYDKLSISAVVFAGQGNRSDYDFSDQTGDAYNMKGNSELNPSNANIALSYGEFSSRFIIDNYHITERDFQGENLAEAITETFDSTYAEMKYNWKIGALTLTPRFNYKKQTPWACPEPVYYNKTAERYTGNLTLTYDLKENINIIAGTESYIDKARVSDKTDPEDYFKGDKKEVEFNNKAFFSQILCRFSLFDFTAGARYDSHSEAGTSFVPRFAVTKVFNKTHFKALYSQAFRSPGIENINLSETIKPEKTSVVEFEAGYQVLKDLLLVANVFDTTIKDPIVYSIEEIVDQDTGETSTEEGYKNFKRTGSRGVDVEVKYKRKKNYTIFSWSYYQSHGNYIDTYKVPNNDQALLAFPQHKAALNSRLSITDKISLNPTIIYLAKRYGYANLDETDMPVIKQFNPAFLMNIYLLYTDILAPNLDLGVGLYNVANTKVEYIQPYNSGHAPLPGQSREAIIKISYGYHF